MFQYNGNKNIYKYYNAIQKLVISDVNKATIIIENKE